MALDAFQITADFLHLSAMCMLLVNIIKTKSCAGISGRSQILFAAVYTTRYLDIYPFQFIYVFLYKMMFLSLTYVAVIAILFIFKETYERKRDTFLTEILVVPALMLAVWINPKFDPLEVLWAFSMYLEAVAILPQLYMIQQKKQVDTNVLCYLVLLGLYRSLYVVHWIYRFYTECHFDPIADAAGLVYTFIYLIALFELMFGKVKVTKADGIKQLWQRKIFLVSNMIDYSNSISVRIDSKNDSASEPILEEKTDEPESK